MKIMKEETKQCQNCKQGFTIESEDFKFYEKIKVPPPTFCPDCRFQRRLLFRNNRVFYRRECKLCKKSVLSVYNKERPYIDYGLDFKECYLLFGGANNERVYFANQILDSRDSFDIAYSKKLEFSYENFQ